MLLLAVDTSGKDGSIALANSEMGNGDRSPAVHVLEVVPLAGGTFSAQLVPQIATLLAKRGFSKHDIGAFVVATGPGSFTGLRVGLAAIKALAEILAKPIAAVSLLEVIAALHAPVGVVATALDAGRGEVYSGLYESDGNIARCSIEKLLKREAVPGEMTGKLMITTDALLAASARGAGLDVREVAPLNAGDVARVGSRKLLAGDTVSPEQLEANYIRRSDAEELLLMSRS